MSQDTVIEAKSLADTIHLMIESYLQSIDNTKVTNLHAMVLEQVEPPLLQALMVHCRYNQSQAAKLLGLSRSTFRAKLIYYFDETYCEQRKEKKAS